MRARADDFVATESDVQLKVELLVGLNISMHLNHHTKKSAVEGHRG